MQKRGSAVEKMGLLIKLVKEREDLYFELLTFVNKNIQSSSNDLDNFTIFNKFLAEVDFKNNNIKSKQTSFITHFDLVFADIEMHPDIFQPFTPNKRELDRLTSRIIEILEFSVTQIRKSVFDGSGKALKEFNRFKIMLDKIVKRQSFIIRDYAEYILNYCNNKFQKQILKIKEYLEKVQAGEDVRLREIYFKQSSDPQISSSPRPKQVFSRSRIKPLNKVDLILHISSGEEQEKKIGKSKNTSILVTKNVRKKVLSERKKRKVHQESQIQFSPPNKQKQTANKLLKFYSYLELNRKEFLEDYVYNQLEEQRHRQDLLNKLRERNKQINCQINNFVQKVFQAFPSSSDEKKKKKKSNSKRGWSNRRRRFSKQINLCFPSDGQKKESNKEKQKKELKDIDKDKQAIVQATEQILETSRHISYVPRPSIKKRLNSPKICISKAPVVFEEDIIPQVPINRTCWILSKPRNKINESIRLKRKNNPTPLENAFSPQHLRYPF